MYTNARYIAIATATGAAAANAQNENVLRLRRNTANAQADTTQSQIIFPGTSQSNTMLMPTIQTTPPAMRDAQPNRSNQYSEWGLYLRRLRDVVDNCIESLPNTAEEASSDTIESSEAETFQEALDRLSKLILDFCIYLLRTISHHALNWMANNPTKAVLGAAIGIALSYYVFAPTTFVGGVFSLLTNLGISEQLLINAGRTVCFRLGISAATGTGLLQATAFSAGAMALIEAVCKILQSITNYINGTDPNISIDDRVNNPDVQQVTDLAVMRNSNQAAAALESQPLSRSWAPSSSSSSSTNTMPQASSNRFSFQPPPHSQDDNDKGKEEDVRPEIYVEWHLFGYKS